MNRWLILFLCWPLLLSAQPRPARPDVVPVVPVVLDGSGWRGPLNIAAHVLYYEDLAGLSFAAIRQQRFLPFIPIQPEPARPKSTIVDWLVFRVKNTSTTQPAEALLNVGRQGQIELYSERGRRMQQTGTYSMPFNVAQWQPIRLRLRPQQTSTYYLKVTNLVRIVDPVVAVLHTPLSLKAWFADNSHQLRWLFLGYVAVAAGLLLMSLFSLSQYVFNSDRVFLYYAMYCFASVLFTIWNTNYLLGLGLPFQVHAITRNGTGVITIFYVLFIAQLIELPAQFPKTWLVFRVLLVGLFIQEIMAVIEHVNGLFFTANWPYIRQGSLSAFISLALIVCLLRSKSPFRRYLLTGIGVVVAIVAYSTSFDLRFEQVDPANGIVINYTPLLYGLGILIENFIFLLALAYRNRLVEVDRKQLQVSYTQQLEAQIVARTREIQDQSRLLEAQHLQQAQDVFDRRMAETEMTALRSQMNPHFIFNCLNSIKLYAMENDSAKASDYLSKFSKLIRMVLENSRSERVTLQNELDTLRLYLDMETMRFKQKLTYRIIVEPGIDAQFLELPPLLIQPYVENAIWHGLMHQPQGGTVIVSVAQPHDDRITITIADDGVGRARAAALKSKSANDRRSFGMKLTSDRIALINQLYQTQTAVTIHDLVSPTGEAQGTEVVLVIPV